MDQDRISRLDKQVREFGSARSPLDQIVGMERVVVAGSRVLAIPAQWTFHEFLISYGRSRLGPDWIAANSEGPNPHPLATSFHDGLCEMRPTGRIDGRMVELRMNGALQAFITFAFDLFTVADNARVQSSLIERIRHLDQYQGARYESFCAASLIRAGFKLDFEDEGDSTRSHCEFTATHKKTKSSFSVEAKSRHRTPEQAGESDLPARTYKIVQDALKKDANHERIIFVDVNLPQDEQPLFEEEWHKEVAKTLNEIEENQRAEDPWPQAIIFFTNRKTFPWFGQESPSAGTVLLTAINHPLFKSYDDGPVKRAYPEIGKLFYAVNELSTPPSQFFGQ